MSGFKICGSNGCTYKSKWDSHLSRHKSTNHDIGVVWFYCDVEGCEYKAKRTDTLKEHKMTHGIGIIWHTCDICGEKFKTNSILTRHHTSIHETNIIWFCCKYGDCEYKAKRNDTLQEHISLTHTMDFTWVTCDLDGCLKKFKTNSQLKTQKEGVHHIDATWYNCDIYNCNYKTTQKHQVKRHKSDIHNIGVTWHQCNHCDYQAKRNDTLNRHLSNVHDIGPHECDYCVKNTFSHIKYVCPKSLIESSICKECFKKVTGYTSRIEKEISEYLDKVPELFPYLIGSDRAFKTLGGCSLYRPDKLYIGVDLNIIFECDEHQHSGSNYKCDERRISEMFDEFETKKLVVVRWNPDSYKVPKDTKRVPKKQRFQRAKEVLIDLLKNPPHEPVSVIYMYYDDDNDNVVRNFPKIFLEHK